MAIILKFQKHTLHFKFDAQTSRGALRMKECWIVKVFDKKNDKVYGLGEVSVIERLSHDYHINFEKELEYIQEDLVFQQVPKNEADVFQLVNKLVYPEHPSIKFALETALLDLINGGTKKIIDNGFYSGKIKIPINGLIWMGSEDFMKAQLDQKIKEGFKCIKMKVGAIDFEKECHLLRSVRKDNPKEKLILRVDANGGFITQEVLKQLEVLEEFDLHSVEQPIMPQQWHAMQLVCLKSTIPIALDEELIGVFDVREQRRLLETIRPAYIVLKPSMLGGIQATRNWIKLAESLQIGWWITSALESNIGLNAICQLTAAYPDLSYQGLGTGQLYENNFHSPLSVIGEQISYNQNMTWDDLIFE